MAKLSKTSIRQWHSYIGLFIAPSVLFFALTGAVQIFNLHEKHGNYQPLAIVEKLSSVHKDQVFALGDHHGAPAADALGDKSAGAESQSGAKDGAESQSGAKDGAESPSGAKDGAASRSGAKDEDDKLEVSTFILKIFFLLVACCLALSTAFGLWMGLTQTRQKRLAWTLVITGAVVPVGLLFL